MSKCAPPPIFKGFLKKINKESGRWGPGRRFNGKNFFFSIKSSDKILGEHYFWRTQTNTFLAEHLLNRKFFLVNTLTECLLTEPKMGHAGCVTQLFFEITHSQGAGLVGRRFCPLFSCGKASQRTTNPLLPLERLDMKDLTPPK